ncbi:hypothetical protein A2415_03610 [candidate division WWE3 bacterium RIFOXYC1_FULL_39_7]|uniref:Uncharacterized protein n=1 Tax=candidate division WWE3 bacterium RIFOXYC1_FULL_39_7 TaxID=1802643 RepID=A0A1F4WKS4_UNCKA|nr:MAG: hypothetical protein A2415_03610 [candidate division WWE3 bacterium RIFOXYC1_FULL_39_7]
MKKLKMLDERSVIEFEMLTWQEASQGRIYLGSRDVQKYLVTPDYWKEITREELRKAEILAISKVMLEKHPDIFTKANVTSKVKLMVLTLVSAGLVARIDEEEIMKPIWLQTAREPFWGIDFLHRKVSLAIFLVFALYPFIFFALAPDFFPKPDDFFWHERVGVSFFTFFAFSWFLGLIHELAHFAIAKINGLKTTIRFSYRLNYLVLETSTPDVYSLPKKWRLTLYASGIVVDLIVITIIYDILALTPLPLWGLLKQAVLVEWLGILWQFMFFMKTDIYYLLRDTVGFENLHQDAVLRIKTFLLRTTNLADYSAQRRRWINIYALFIIFGTVVAVVRYGFYYLPIVFSLLALAIQNLLDGIVLGNLYLFIDGLVVVLVEVFSFSLLFYLLLRNRVNRR